MFNTAPRPRHVSIARFCAIALAALLVACGSGSSSKQAATAAKKVVGDTLSDSALMSVADLGRYEGSDKAPIWIVMVSDFQCPYCKEWHDSTLTQVRKEYVETGKARLAYLNLPIQGHQHAVVLAKASLCASAQQKFWPFANSIFSKQTTVRNLADVHPLLNTISDSLQMNTAEFQRCQNSGAIDALLQSDLRQVGQARIQSTPSFFVGQFILQGAVPFKSFKTAVDSALVIAALKH